MTDWNERELSIDISELGLAGASVEAWEDGPEAASKASDWSKRSFNVSEGAFKISLAPGGGWAGIVKFAE